MLSTRAGRLPLYQKHPAPAWLAVRDGRRNRKLHLRAVIDPTEDRQLAAHHLRALLHARQAMMSGARALLDDLRVDAAAIIPHAHAKQPLAVMNHHFDAGGVRVAEG